MLDNLKQSFSQTPRTLGLLREVAPGGAVALSGLTLLGAALPLAIAWAGKKIVDAVVAGDAPGAIAWVAAELCIVAGQALVLRGLGLLRSVLGARLALDVNVRILKKALALELKHFEDPEFYDQLTKARREASSRPISVVTGLFQLFQNVLTLAGYVALLVQFSGFAVAALLAAAIPATIAEMRFSGLAFRLGNWRAPETRRLNYLEYVLANDGHAKEVQLFGLGPLLLTRYRELGERIVREDRGLAVRRAGWGYGLSLLATGAFYGCYSLMAGEAAAGSLTLGNLTLYLVAFRQGQQAFQSILQAIGGMYEDNLYMSNLFKYLAIPAGASASATATATATLTSASTATAAAGQLVTAGAEPGIRFEGVGFRYPGQESWALRGVDLAIPPGQSLGLVGHNGSGKTTLIKLLTRLYEPSEGRIRLDGKDLGSWDEHALRRRIGVIFQDFNRYQLPLQENVGVGSVERIGDPGRVREALGRADASELLRTLPDGLATMLGRWFHLQGTELSGGQWQKIALARAFMREEADILVLDEPTASLDAEAEHAVFERFRELAGAKTRILISHRLPTVRAADRIVVLDHGRIVEAGSHDELVGARGRYARLFELQAEGYR